MTHNLKIRLTFADAILRGDKTFEIRKNDRGFQKHDEVVFDVVDDYGRHLQHGLNHRRYRINYVLNGWGLGADYCVFSIEPADVVDSTPEVETAQTNCEYCHEDSEGYVSPLEKNSHAYIRFGMSGWAIELKANGWRGEAKIKYCPICGRRLTDG